MFADGIGFVCFYHAEHVLFAIAKFLVHLLGKRGERRGMVRSGGQWRRQGGALRGAEAPPPKCVKGARVMGVGTLLANVTLLILSIMQFTQFICSHDHTVRCSQ